MDLNIKKERKFLKAIENFTKRVDKKYVKKLQKEISSNTSNTVKMPKRMSLARLARKYALKKGVSFGRKRRHNLSSGWNNKLFKYTRTINVSALETGIGVTGQLSNPAPGNAFTFTTVTSATALIQYGAFNYYFQLANLPNVTEFTNLYDAYRIDKVKIRIIPYQNVTEGGTAGVSPIFHWVIDHDSAGAVAATEAGIQALQQYSTYKRKMLNDGITISLVPRSAQAMYSGTFTGYGESKAHQWIDCSSATVQHYGLIGIFEAASPNTNTNYCNFRMETTYFLSFKATR